MKGVAYNTKAILKDKDGKPIPQYFDEVADDYKPLLGEGGGNRVAQYYSTKEAKRQTLTPNQEAVLIFAQACEAFDILNIGPGDIYLDIDSSAEIGGAGDVLVPEGAAYSLQVKGTAVHVIGDYAAVVQCVGYR
ncbi:MAG: hypothetical protein HPY55_00060 [Firmicutes bacterium]|nr:hypothetical protein [Bacillota bacterium]